MNQPGQKSEHRSVTPARKAVLFSTLILVSGIIIGAGLTLIVTGNSGNPRSLPPGPEYTSSRMVEHIVQELKLSPEQREQLNPIVQEHTKAMEDIRNQARPQISDEIKKMNEEIIAILDEGQKQIWEEKIKEMQDHFTQMRQRRGQGDGRRNGRDPDSESRRGDRFPGPPPGGRPAPPVE